MATLDWHCRRTDGVTLVQLLLESEAPERVRVESTLQPVWPPRRYGLPAEGWDDAGFEGTVGPDRRLVLGYASPAEPVDPPAEIVAAEPGGTPKDGDRRARARGLVRALGTARPARDVVSGSTATATAGGDGQGGGTSGDNFHQPTGSRAGPHPPNPAGAANREKTAAGSEVLESSTHLPDSETTTAETPDPTTVAESYPGTEEPPSPGQTDDRLHDDSGPLTAHEDPDSLHSHVEADSTDAGKTQDSPQGSERENLLESPGETTVATSEPVESGDLSETSESVEAGDLSDSPTADTAASDVEIPDTNGDPADPSLAAVERRVEAGEQLAAVTTVGEAKEAIERFGGIRELRQLQTDLARDRRALRQAAQRQEDLTARLDRIEIPLTVLERLA